MNKYNYTVGYADFKGIYHTITIDATDCKDLLFKIAENIPNMAFHILNVSYNQPPSVLKGE